MLVLYGAYDIFGVAATEIVRRRFPRAVQMRLEGFPGMGVSTASAWTSIAAGLIAATAGLGYLIMQAAVTTRARASTAPSGRAPVSRGRPGPLTWPAPAWS